MLKNTKDSFGLVSKSFHWVVGILILWLLSVGFQMVTIPPSPDKFWVYALHKSFGVLILTLAAGRLAWRLISPRPAPLASHKEWEVKLSEAIHFFLYVCMFLMPLSGWAMSSAGGFPAEIFGLFSLPQILPKNEMLFGITRNIHEFTAYGILGALALHFAGAFKHHFIDRDATLKRMTSVKVGFKFGLVLVVVAGLLWSAPVALAIFAGDDSEKSEAVSDNSRQDGNDEAQTQAQDDSEGWVIDNSTSSIAFEATQYGEVFQGEFKKFGGKIIFDPKRLDLAYADIWIDITSISTGSSDRDGQAKGTEWFDTENFPKAQFVADDFEKTGVDQYLAHGALTIRGKAVEMYLPFSLQIRESPEGQSALMESKITLNRLDFGVGQGQWQKTDAIGDKVTLNITVLADTR